MGCFLLLQQSLLPCIFYHLLFFGCGSMDFCTPLIPYWRQWFDLWSGFISVLQRHHSPKYQFTGNFPSGNIPVWQHGMGYLSIQAGGFMGITPAGGNGGVL